MVKKHIENSLWHRIWSIVLFVPCAFTKSMWGWCLAQQLRCLLPVLKYPSSSSTFTFLFIFLQMYILEDSISVGPCHSHEKPRLNFGLSSAWPYPTCCRYLERNGKTLSIPVYLWKKLKITCFNGYYTVIKFNNHQLGTAPLCSKLSLSVPMWVPVLVPAAPCLIQPLAFVPKKVSENGQSAWASAPTWDPDEAPNS